MPIRRFLTILLALTSVLATTEAWANGAHVVLLAEGTGPGSAAIAEALRSQLATHYTVDDAKTFRRTMASDWEGAKLVDTLDSDRRSALVDELRRVAIVQGESLVLVADLGGAKGERSVRITLVGRRGEPFDIVTKLRAKSDAQADGVRIYGEIELPVGAIADAEAPRANPGLASGTRSGLLGSTEAPHDAPAARSREPVGDAEGPTETGSPRDVPSAGPAVAASGAHRAEQATVVLEPELGFGMRHFDYRDRVSPNQRSYDLGAAPLIGVRGELFPFASSGNKALRALGIAARYDHSVLLQSSLASANNSLAPAQNIDTSWSDFDVALRGRMPISDQATLGATAGFGMLDVGFSGAGAIQQELPTVGYRFIRLGADARLRIWRFALTASADYLALTSSGALSDRYPRESGGGLDVGAGIAIPLGEHVEARTGVRYQRFFHSMNPVVGDANVAGGALDELARWDSGVAFHY